MTLGQQREGSPAAQICPAEETLRLIAGLPAPEDLVERVQARLRTAPPTARVMRWPEWKGIGEMRYANALRGVAAAAIVCLVAGSGWQIYSHVQVGPTAQAVPRAVPARIGNGFSSAGAMRTPDALRRQVWTPAVPPVAAKAADATAPGHPVREHGEKRAKAAIAGEPQP